MSTTKPNRTDLALPAAFALGVLVSIVSLPAFAMLDPARVYCESLGYDYVTAHTPKGALGLCKLPGDRYVDAGKFLEGLVALDHSWCAQQGLEARRVTDPALCLACTACVTPDGELVRATEAMGLVTAEGECGDGNCGTAESYDNCPADCSSGSYDEFCDGLADGTCDLDCTDIGKADPDCVGTTDPTPDTPTPEDSGCGCHTTRAGSATGVAALLLIGLSLVLRRRTSRPVTTLS